MKKNLILPVLILVAVFVLSGCGQKSETSSGSKTNSGENSAKEDAKAGGIADICNYFPKEIVESALGKSIAKVEKSDLVDPTCYYYTKYEDGYEKSYSGAKKPGGPKIVVVYDTKDFAKDRISNEKGGSKYTNDSSIGMDNFVVRNNVNKIWLVALSLGDDKYIRMKAIDDAVTGEELVKIAKKFAEKIQSAK